MEDVDKKYPEGHFIGMWIGICIAIFSGLGVPLSFATNNPGLIGIGPAIGVSIGVAIGSSVESKYRREGKIRPLTQKEKKGRRTALFIGLAILIAGIAIFLVLLLK